MNRLLTFSNSIPDEESSHTFTTNAWISPSGEFWGFEGARHEIAAAYIAIFNLGADDKTLKRGNFFSESWESWLMSKGWLCIKNVSWLSGDDRPSTFKNRSPITEKQKTCLFDYCEFFDFNYEEIVESLI